MRMLARLWAVAALLVSMSATTACLAGTTGSLQVSVEVADTAQLAVVGTALALVLDNPPSGGAPVGPTTSSVTKLQYTSVVGGGKSRRIEAALLGAQPPTGTQLTMTAIPPVGGGSTGDCGDSTGPQALGATALAVITGIGGCATGTGVDDGATVTYQFSITDAAHTAVVSVPGLVVTLTITDSQ